MGNCTVNVLGGGWTNATSWSCGVARRMSAVHIEMRMSMMVV